MNKKIEMTHFLVRQMQTNAVVHDAACANAGTGRNKLFDESGHWPKVSVGKIRKRKTRRTRASDLKGPE